MRVRRVSLVLDLLQILILVLPRALLVLGSLSEVGQSDLHSSDGCGSDIFTLQAVFRVEPGTVLLTLSQCVTAGYQLRLL